MNKYKYQHSYKEQEDLIARIVSYAVEKITQYKNNEEALTSAENNILEELEEKKLENIGENNTELSSIEEGILILEYYHGGGYETKITEEVISKIPENERYKIYKGWCGSDHKRDMGSILFRKIRIGLKLLRTINKSIFNRDNEVFNKTNALSQLEKYWDKIEPALDVAEVERTTSNPPFNINQVYDDETLSSLDPEILNRINDRIEGFYFELETHLRNGNLKNADELTARLIWEIVRTPTEPRFGPTDSQGFPRKVFLAIDTLWIKYTDGRFGLSVQGGIWRSVNRDFREFVERLRWGYWERTRSVNGNVITDLTTITIYPRANYSLDAPKGHLPWLLGFKPGHGGYREAYLDRLVECGL